MHPSIFKEKARAALKGKWQKMAWLVFVGTLISGGLQLDAGEIKPGFQVNIGKLNPELRNMLLIGVGICLLLALMVGAVINVGMYNLAGRVLDGENPRMKMLFPRGIIWRAVLMNILRTLIVFSAMIILLIAAAVSRRIDMLVYGLTVAYIPAFFLSYCYSMADYLLLTEEKIGPVQALRESRRRMKGRKSSLFWLELSFIGWALLSMLPQLVVMSLLIDISQQVAIVAGFATGIVSSAFVSVYQIVAKTAFFREVNNPDDGYAERRRAQEEYARQMYENMRRQTRTEAEQQPAEPVVRPAVDEETARRLFIAHHCSRSLMREDGVLEQYDAIGVDSSAESRWLREYADTLIRRFDREPEALDDILRLAAEYAHAEILDRAIMRVDRHIRQQSLSGEELLGMLGRMVALLKSGCFDENLGYVSRKLEQLREMLDRIEAGTGESETVRMLREML